MNDLAKSHGGARPKVHVITQAQVATASRLYLSGLSLANVGEKLGFNAQTIATHLRRAGVALRDPHGRVPRAQLPD
ncbi:hypothetical protein [Microbacterium sp. BH-3-3-3]|uniref:hypothetical protein n=1 Tax=Microbacterium sp. BH-3-3-3 TaxID=1906742 RepID=UPI0009F4CBE5|nr:hypothetical protein [Microbacterium sp. BH-3-3-3]